MTNITPLISPIIKNVTPNDARKVCTFTTHNDILGDLVITTRINHDGNNRLITEIKNKLGKTFGHEIYSLDSEARSMFGYYMEVNPEYRSGLKKKYRFGEIMRLSSIISMLENGIKNFGIYSKDTAIYFHSKYKFEPNIVRFDNRNMVLNGIIKNTAGQKGFEEIFEQATKYMERILENPPAEEQRELTKKTSELAKIYLKKVSALQSSNSHPLNVGMDMILTNETVVKNKEFFNELFKKHGIDYRI